ncbi:hypothetical protein BLA29_008396 [Euroglyphus maynei]|uniref:Uncharacterized protein n=1 Tax=Euroglyphus maynei TaxID=6958 RepID=A0A1Y3BB28_EURMA|nr:hypothetical protein BLA29_008396 [Euroglyphus maynei]
MEIDIGEFDCSNHAHLRDANNLLDNIIDDNGYNYDIVMDIGCGSGRVLDISLPWDKLDPMIRY